MLFNPQPYSYSIFGYGLTFLAGNSEYMGSAFFLTCTKLTSALNPDGEVVSQTEKTSSELSSHWEHLRMWFKLFQY